MLVVGIFAYIAIRAYTANADTLIGDSSLNFKGVVKPTQAAQIINPKNKQVFNNRSITINGTCPTTPPDNVVKIIDNGINIGTAACNDGQFRLNADLFNLGINYVRARVSDIFNQDGPDSVVIGVYYQPFGAPGSSSGNSALFNVGIASAQYAVVNGHAYDVTLQISGGKAPYALNIDWGDGSNNLISRPDSSDTTVEHIYSLPAQYQITLNATDAGGKKAYAQTAVLVSGPMAATSNTTSQGGGLIYGQSMLATMLKVYGVITAAVFIFWLGEHYEYSYIVKSNKLRRLHR